MARKKCPIHNATSAVAERFQKQSEKSRKAFLKSFTARDGGTRCSRFARLRRQLAADESTPLVPEMHRFTSRRRKAANGTEMGVRSLCPAQLDNRKIARSKRQAKFERAVQRSICISIVQRILTTSLASPPASTKKPIVCQKNANGMRQRRTAGDKTRKAAGSRQAEDAFKEAPIVGYKRPQIRWRLEKEHPLPAAEADKESEARFSRVVLILLSPAADP